MGHPERGDVIVFVYPQDRCKDFVKRVVAVPGDELVIRNKKVYINGDLVEDAHARFEDRGISLGADHVRDNLGPVKVPDGHVFVMGDNRDRSFDSRFWGFVPIEDVRGRAFVKYWSWDSETAACAGGASAASSIDFRTASAPVHLMKATLTLADGTSFAGRSFGSEGEAAGRSSSIPA